MNLHHVNPLVVSIDDFATPAECKAIMDAAHGRLERAVMTRDGVHTYEGQERTNSDAGLSPKRCGAVMGVALRVSIHLRLPVAHAELPVVLHYAPGQEYKPHLDGFPLADADPALDEEGGQRLFTSILFLNQPEEGGATGFPTLKLSVQPRPGRLVIFANTLAGARDVTQLALHAGEPVTAGEKWAMTIWWREKAIEPAKGRSSILG